MPPPSGERVNYPISSPLLPIKQTHTTHKGLLQKDTAIWTKLWIINLE